MNVDCEGRLPKIDGDKVGGRQLFFSGSQFRHGT